MTTTKPLRLIGLTGLAGTGKDTVRRMLEDDHEFAGLAFADPLRQMIGALLSENGFSTQWMYDREFKERPIDGLGLSYRELAQTLGTEWGRKLHPDIWVRIAGQAIASLSSRGEHQFVISDVRFPNEAAWIKEAGGEIWVIKRPDAPAVRDHDSERLVQTIAADRAIDNSGTVEDLWCQVAGLVGGEKTA